MMKLYTYWRSSAAYRVRIALALKNIPYESVYIHLLREGGQQKEAAYRALNPQQLVPTLVLEDGTALPQSTAILEYLEETYPEPALLPDTPRARARVRALCQAVACDIHPLNNLRVLGYLTDTLAIDDDQKQAWYREWLTRGFEAIEEMLSGSPETGRFCHGDRPGMADACLIPQVFNARRFDVDLSPYPTIVRIDAACVALDAFDKAHPNAQGDANS